MTKLRRLSSVIAGITACLLIGVVVFPCIFGFFSFVGDDCLDDVVLYSLRSDGHRLYVSEWTENPTAVPDPQLSADMDQPSVQVSNTNSGIEMLTISDGENQVRRQGYSFGSPIWSTKTGKLFVIENARPGTSDDDRSFILSWSPTDGFKKLTRDMLGLGELSLSLDQSHLVALITSTDQNQILDRSLETGEQRLFSCPSSAYKPLMIGPSEFLFLKHDKGHFSTVVRWQIGQIGPPKKLECAEPLIDVAALGSHVWGLTYTDRPNVLELDDNLSTVKRRIECSGY
ncbi:MAG: hypothetical protein JST12_02970 [Armatimonadetes bacterium]|nr:hypothetical protein [Armatimonadota bacterium]